jgi:excisionase family DNA binding protein
MARQLRRRRQRPPSDNPRRICTSTSNEMPSGVANSFMALLLAHSGAVFRQQEVARLTYSLPEAAAALGVSVAFIEELVARGELARLKLGGRRGRRLIPVGVLEELTTPSSAKPAA